MNDNSGRAAGAGGSNGKMHVQEISATTDSSVAEHDLTELVHPPAQLQLHVVSSPQQQHSYGYGYPEGRTSRVQQYLSEQHAYAYQNRSLPSPPVSSGSAPTVLQSFPSWDPTWRSGGVSEDGRAYTYHIPQSRAAGYSPETRGSPGRLAHQEGSTTAWNEEGANNVVEPFLGGWEAEYSEEDQKRFTEGEYRLGVGYDVSHANQSGKTDRIITEERKAERLKALQKEFGRGTPVEMGEKAGGAKKSKKGGPKEKEKESFKTIRAREKEEQARINAELGVGKDGKLSSSGPKQRAAMRWLQGILALVAICGGIGGALLTHPDDDDEPAPSGSISTWALYILSFISFLVTFWTFVIRRCYRRKKSTDAGTGGHAINPAGMVLPVFSQQAYGPVPGGKKLKGGWFKPGGAKSQRSHAGQPMTVNLVLDPATLAGLVPGGTRPPSRHDDPDDEPAEKGKKKRKTRQLRHDDLDDGDSSDTALDSADHEDDDEDADFAIPDSSKRRASKPLGVIDAMAAMRLQDRWRAARRSMKRQAVQDVVLCLLWLGVSIWLIGFGERCPSGSSAGWCDLYNTAVASGTLLSVCFGTSFVFCWLDLRRSRSVPRLTRQQY